MLLSRRLSITSLLPFALLSYRIAKVYLIQAGLFHNPYMDAVIPGTYTAQMPSPSLSKNPTLAKEEVVVFMVGSCTNHPLGIFAPGAQEIVTYFTAMMSDLQHNKTKFGLLGSSTWLSKERDTTNENLWVLYFRDLEGLQRFSEEKAHREGWDWYLKFEKRYGHLAIRHEVYHVPKNRWENVYLNSRRTGFGATSFEVGRGEEEGRGESWRQAGTIDVKGGKLKSIKARMGISGLEMRKDE
jgi:Domain of unknown function (DUF4188)